MMENNKMMCGYTLKTTKRKRVIFTLMLSTLIFSFSCSRKPSEEAGRKVYEYQKRKEIEHFRDTNNPWTAELFKNYKIVDFKKVNAREKINSEGVSVYEMELKVTRAIDRDTIAYLIKRCTDKNYSEKFKDIVKLLEEEGKDELTSYEYGTFIFEKTENGWQGEDGVIYSKTNLLSNILVVLGVIGIGGVVVIVVLYFKKNNPSSIPKLISTRINQKETAIYCTQCGCKNEASNKFCQDCGIRLE